MPLDNTLNVSELLRRLGVKGDSQGSASLLEALRLNLIIGDMSDLLPPLRSPRGGASMGTISAVGVFNKWSLQVRSPGGATVLMLSADSANIFDLWITPANVLGAALTTSAENYSFGQAVDSIFTNHVAGAKATPPRVFVLQGLDPMIDSNFEIWIGPGEFFNVESRTANQDERIAILWKEYPAALNPG